MREVLLLAAALVSCVAGFAWFALAMDVHWRQTFGARSLGRSTQVRLRILGTTALAVSLAMCLEVDHPSIATLVWIMMLAAAALIVAFTLSWRPQWFGFAIPWRREER